MSGQTIVRRLLPALVATLALAACADGDAGDQTTDDDTASPTASATEEPTTDDATATADEGASASASASADPTAEPAVVSLSPTATELLFAIGAGDHVVAADEFSDYPAEAPTTDLSGFEPNAEAILSYDPDVVVVSFDPNDIVSQLESAGVEVLVHPTATTFDDTWSQTVDLGEVTGDAEGAEQFVAETRAELDELADESLGEGLTYYHEVSPDLYSATSGTFVGEVYGLFGLENVADEAPDEFDSGFPQLSAEYLVETDPDVVFLACVELCDVSAESFAERDGFGDLTAVEQDAVVELDDDVAGRWGPRVVEYAQTVRDALTDLRDG